MLYICNIIRTSNKAMIYPKQKQPSCKKVQGQSEANVINNQNI